MKVIAIRSDHWLGITRGREYDTKYLKTDHIERILVITDGYVVPFNEKDFAKIKRG